MTGEQVAEWMATDGLLLAVAALIATVTVVLAVIASALVLTVALRHA